MWVIDNGTVDKMSKIAITRALRLSGTSIDITKIFAYASLRDGRAVDAFTKCQKETPTERYIGGPVRVFPIQGRWIRNLSNSRSYIVWTQY